MPFARRTLTMTALEPDPAMASIAQRNCAGLDVRVEITSFEDWAAPPGPAFKLVMAAQSWHWVQPVVRLPEGARGARRRRCARVCSGTVPTGPRPRCATRSTPRTNGSRRSSARGCRASRAQDVGRRACVEELIESDLFGEVSATEHAWETEYGRDAYLQLLDTQSDHRLLDPATRERLFAEVGHAIDDAGGTFPASYVTELYLTRRAG